MRSQGLRKMWAGLALLVSGLFLAAPAVAMPLAPWQTQIPLLDRFLEFLANPNVAYLLLVIGLLGFVGEIATPGVGFPGVLGTICLILALVGFGQLPTNWAGVALIVAGVAMFLLDFKVSGFGLSIGALIAFGLGSLLLFTPFWVTSPEGVAVRLNPWLIVGTTVGVAAFFFLGVSAAIKSQRFPVAVGRETFVGKVGTVRQPLRPTGIVHLEGEDWSALSANGAEIPAGTPVRVIAVEGLTLRVEPAPKTSDASSANRD